MENSNLQKGLDFEKKCEDKLKQLGFTNVALTKWTDYGADIVANDGHIKYIFQCKNVKSKQGLRAVQEILAAKNFYTANRCGVISDSDFTLQAYNLAKPNYCYLLTSNEFFNLTDKNSFITNSVDILSQVGYDYDIIKNYENLKKKLGGKTPTWEQLDKSLRHQIKKKHKNYSVFLTAIGDRFLNSRPTDEQLINEYKRIRSIVGKTLTGSDIKKHSTFPFNSFHTYPLTKLQKECGDRPNIERGISKENLITEYFALAKKIGRNPNSVDLDNYGQYKYSYYVPHRWKSFSEFLKEANIPESQVTKRRYSEEETVVMFCLIEMLIRIKENDFQKEINSTILKKLKYNDKVLFSKSTITSKFDSIDIFLRKIEKDLKYSDIRFKLQQLLKDIVE